LAAAKSRFIVWKTENRTNGRCPEGRQDMFKQENPNKTPKTFTTGTALAVYGGLLLSLGAGFSVAQEMKSQDQMTADLREMELADIAADPELNAYALQRGGATFQLNCTRCHGPEAKGQRGKITILDVAGRIVYAGSGLLGARFVWDGRDLESGIYILKIKTRDKIYTKRLVKVR